MADDPTDPGNEPDDGDQPDPTPDPATGGGDTLGDAGRRAIEAERKARRDAEARLKARIKELEPLANKAKELEDSTKTEAQRLSDERDAHRARAERAEQDLLRLKVALRKGLTETQAKRLVGASEEELEADADELLKDIGTQQKQGNRVPHEGKSTKPSGDDPLRDYTARLFGRDD